MTSSKMSQATTPVSNAVPEADDPRTAVPFSQPDRESETPLTFVSDFADARQWDAYVENHPQSRFCHLYGYRCLENIYGYKPRYMAFLKDDRIVGVLPAFEAKSLFFGRRLVSQPFSEYGGLLLDENLPEHDFTAIMERLQEITRASGASALEMHGRLGIGAQNDQRYLAKNNAQSYAYLPLESPLDEIWSKVVTYQVRKAVNKAQRSGVTVVERSDPDTIVREFYPFYTKSMRRLGVPPHTIQYYLQCQAAFRDRMKIFWAIHNGAPIAGLLGFSCGQRVSIVNIVSDECFWELRPNDLIHWEYIKWAHSAGFRCFDFGSVRYDSQLQYKKKWGCTIDEHGYYFLTGNPAKPGEQASTFDSSSGLMARCSSLWSRFVPQPVGCLVGPFLRRHLVR